MAFPPRVSLTSAPGEPAIRRLGVRSSTNIERPIRAQVVLLGVGLLLALAIPLYLLRSPADNVEAEAVGPAPLGFAPSVPAGSQPDQGNKMLELSEPTSVRCGANPSAANKSGRLCDRLDAIEKSFAAAINEAFDCAPRTGEKGTLNYVLTVDFAQHRLHVFPGASGTWKGPQARRATQCVKRALAAPDWEKLAHEHAYYEIAVLATYQPPPPTEAPLFE
jgi:hypothetical protein